MVDFSKIFNIVFVSVCAGLLLLFLVSVIAVAAKGKRKCGAFDVLLRILSVLVLIVSAVMVACSVLTMLEDGSMCIVAAEENGVAAAALVMGEKTIELPLAELFVALSTVIGFGLVAVLFILSLTALIVDCLVANKKDGNKKGEKKQKKEPAVQKTPEQIKREAELERIRRIGESAVRKTSSVASAEKTEQPAEQPVSEPAPKTEPIAEEENDFDWRTSPAPEPKQEQTGFVGIKDDEPDSFDSFDSFDDEPEQNAESQEQEVEGEGYSEEIADQPAEEAVEEQAYDAAEEVVEETTEELVDEAVEETEEILYDDDAQFTLDDTEGEVYDESEQAELDGNAEQTESYEDEQVVEEYEQPAVEEYEDPASEEYEEQAIAEDEYEQSNTESEESVDIEPDRGIYIPEIRTVTPQQKPENKKPTAAKKPAAKKSTSTKPAKPKKSGGGQKPSIPTDIPPEKKLPVTRRYVILDRHNAVNMFGEYLKERNQADKDKLKSSINTIIIE